MGASSNNTDVSKLNARAHPLVEPMDVDSNESSSPGLVQQLPLGRSSGVSHSASPGLVQQLPAGAVSDVSQLTPSGLVQQLPPGDVSDVSQSGLRPLFVEVFSGKASFSRAIMVQAGFEVVSVDHDVDAPYAPVVTLDLTTKSGQSILMEILSSKRLVAVHFGLPCGTASKARDRPISQELQRRGVPSPAPLRSADYPLGIPGISGINKVKVEKANELYRFTLCMLVFLDKRVAVSIENPFGSYLWAALVKLTMEHSKHAMALYNKLEMVRFHSCCHGSKRRKDTGWLSTPGVFKPLYAVCAHDHAHEPWGVSWSMGTWKFDTSSEASYPSLLAQRATACLVKYATTRGFALPYIQGLVFTIFRQRH